MEHAMDIYFSAGHLVRPLIVEGFRQLFKQAAPSRFSHLRTIGTFEEDSLMRANEVGSFIYRDQFDGNQHGRNALSAEGHQGRSDDSLIGNDVLKTSVIGDDDSWKQSSLLE